MVTLQVPPFNNVVASGKASVALDRGMTYHRIVLELGGTAFTKAMITRIKAKLNGKTFYELTGSQLDTLNKYRGIYDDATHLTLDFTEPGAKTLGGQIMGAVGTAAGVNSFHLEIDIAGATAPTLAAIALVSEPMPLDRILAMVPIEADFSAAGKFPVVLPHGPEAGHLVKRVHFFSADVSKLEVKKNGVPVFEEVSKTFNEFTQREYGKTPQAGLYVYDPIMDRDMKRVLNTENARTLQFNTTVDAGGTFTIVGEYLALLKNL